MRSLALAFVAALTLAAPTAHAQPVMMGETQTPAQPVMMGIDRVVAVVGATPVLLSELRDRAAPFLLKLDAQKLAPEARAKAEKELAGDLLQHMIDGVLVAQAAARVHVVVTEAEIDQALGLVAKDNQLTVPQLLLEAQKLGMTEAHYRDEIARQILVAKMVRLRPIPRSVDVAKLDERAHLALLDRLGKEWLAELRRDTYVELRPLR